MFFQSYNSVNNVLFNNLHLIPKVDLIVGIPRSGVIIANMISEYLRIPCTDLFSFNNTIETHKIQEGSTTPIFDYNNVKTILLVDDTVGSGKSMQNAVNLIKDKNVKIITFAPYILPDADNKVDIYFVKCIDHYFPWNIFKRFDLLPFACCDIDGVLCPNVPPFDDDDGERYINYLSNDKQLIIPQAPIGTLVTGRLAKYRTITENWLKEKGIRFQNLVMLNLNNNIERAKINVGEYKGNFYKDYSNKYKIFIESSWNEAQVIYNISKKPVYCTETGLLLQ